MAVWGRKSGHRPPLDSSGVEALLGGRETPPCDQHGCSLRVPLFFGLGNAEYSLGRRGGSRHASFPRHRSMSPEPSFSVSTGNRCPNDSVAVETLMKGQKSPEQDQNGNRLRHPLFFGLRGHQDPSAARQSCIDSVVLPRLRDIAAVRAQTGSPDSTRSWKSRSRNGRRVSPKPLDLERPGSRERREPSGAVPPLQSPLPAPQPVAAAGPWRNFGHHTLKRSRERADRNGSARSSRSASTQNSLCSSRHQSPCRSSRSTRHSSPRDSVVSSHRSSSSVVSPHHSSQKRKLSGTMLEVSRVDRHEAQPSKDLSTTSSVFFPKGEALSIATPSAHGSSPAQGPVVDLPAGKPRDLFTGSNLPAYLLPPAGKPSGAPGHTFYVPRAYEDGHRTPLSAADGSGPPGGMMHEADRKAASCASSARSESSHSRRFQQLKELKNKLQELQKSQAQLEALSRSSTPAKQPNTDDNRPLSVASSKTSLAKSPLSDSRIQTSFARERSTRSKSESPHRTSQDVKQTCRILSHNGSHTYKTPQKDPHSVTESTRVSSAGSRSTESPVHSVRSSRNDSSRRSRSVPSQSSRAWSFESRDLPLNQTSHQERVLAEQEPLEGHTVKQPPRPLPLPVLGRGPLVRNAASQTVLRDPALDTEMHHGTSSGVSVSSFTWPWRHKEIESERERSSPGLATQGSSSPLVKRWAQIRAPREFQRAVTPTPRGSTRGSSATMGRTSSDRWRWLDPSCYRRAASASPRRHERRHEQDEVFSDRIRSYNAFDESPYAPPPYAEVNLEPHPAPRETGRKPYVKHLAPSNAWMHWVGSGDWSQDPARPLDRIGDPQTLARPLREPLPRPLPMESDAAPFAGGHRSWHFRNGQAGPAKTHRQGPRFTSPVTASELLVDPLENSS